MLERVYAYNSDKVLLASVTLLLKATFDTDGSYEEQYGVDQNHCFFVCVFMVFKVLSQEGLCMVLGDINICLQAAKLGAIRGPG